MRVVFIISFFLIQVAGFANAAFLPGSFSLKFEKSYLSEIPPSKLKKSTGVIDYKYPGNIRFEIIEPVKNKLTFVSNEQKSWYYVPPFLKGEQGELTVRPSGEMALLKFFDVLKKGMSSNDHYSVEKSDKQYTLIFSKDMSKKLELNKAILIFTDKKCQFMAIRKMVLFDNNGKEVTFSMNELKLEVKFSPNHFLFAAPPNTRTGN